VRIVTTMDDLPAQLRGLTRRLKQAIVRGSTGGAHRGRAIIVPKTPRDTGQAAAAWQVHVGPPGSGELAKLVNDAPYIGILEEGARPHPVSRAGVEAIYAWVWRHRLNLQIVTKSGKAARGATAEKMARSVTWAIVGKLKTKGQKPTYFIRDALPELRAAMVAEVVAELNRVAATAGRGKAGGTK
jgi:hypothetical protein